MDLGLDGRIALVTAGSRGLGFATARALAGEGVRLVVSARGKDTLESAAASLRSLGAEVATRVADMADPDVPDRLVAAAADEFGGLDIVVANAGGPPVARSLDVTEDQLDAALNLNLRSSIRLIRAAVPVLRDRGWGRICCITSYSVVQPVPTLALSNTARVGLWAWAKSAAQDLASEGGGITLNLACPGPHATDRMKELGGSGAMGDPADFGKVVAFLCSQPAGYINGAAVVVDGGATLAL
ncbi:MAG TPA: SDR family oxidoreductase [Acidimicrobiales bacterium]|nr:SDR family oxidoreductase [Acidimicrobiales bacterium]